MIQRKEPIDFVITWVDDTDPKWQELRKSYVADATMMDCDDRLERYRDWDNLRYWFRGVEKFAPWVHKIYFVTYGHMPEWLNVAHPKLQVVRHEDYIPGKYLPTFNSHAIEWNFHRIPGISESFVYFNDDVFLLRPVKPEMFFENGKPKDMLALQPVVANSDDAVMPYVYLNNSMVLAKYFDKRTNMRKQPGAYWHPGYPFLYFAYNFMERMFPKFTGFYDVHGPSPLQCSTYKILWEKEPELLDEVCSHAFRDAKDISQYVLRDWQKLSGNFVPSNVAGLCRYYNAADSDRKMLQTIRRQKAAAICINDNDFTFDFELARMQVKQAFEEILPERSDYEQ